MRWVWLFLLLPLAGCLQDAPSPEASGPSRVEAYLWPDPAELVVEVDYAPGQAPPEAVLARLQEILDRETDKATVTVLPATDTLAYFTEDHAWSDDDLRAFHGAQRSDAPPWEHVADGKARLHVAFLQGHGDAGRPDEDLVAVGKQIGPFIAVFMDPMRDAGIDLDPTGLLPGLPNPAFEESVTAVLVHELGHALGLVNHGAPMTVDRIDPDDPCRCHSRNRDSVMYASTERFNVTRFLLDEQWVADDYDADDRADLAAVRARYR